MMGACHVHDRIRPYHVEQQRRVYPDAAVVVHPECGCTSACMRQMAQEKTPVEMMQFHVRPKGWCNSCATRRKKSSSWRPRSGIFIHFQSAAPDKTIVPASREAVCAFMKQRIPCAKSINPCATASTRLPWPRAGCARSGAHRAHVKNSLNPHGRVISGAANRRHSMSETSIEIVNPVGVGESKQNRSGSAQARFSARIACRSARQQQAECRQASAICR